MEKKYFKIGTVPAILWGGEGDKVYLCVHGKGGDAEEAAGFAEAAFKKGWRTISVDLPEHGSRKGETDAFYPWVAVPELHAVMDYIKKNYSQVALTAGSIGAWFSMLALGNVNFERCLFVSPLLDMNALIGNMMLWAGVSEDELREKQEIKTDFGETLSWRYYLYAKEHPIVKWDCPTAILYGEKDHLTSTDTVKDFCRRFKADLTVMPEGEHWFHTPEQLRVLSGWREENIGAGM